ncbi:MAG: haloacid dehalogenase [Phormidesmis sp. RL_2_1]|nr:haloacid dehalogenase [Phormidesmis sp. RL_2_1]
MANRVIVTALDGVLLNFTANSAATADCALLKPVMASLKAQRVAVIVFTGRDRAELEPIRQQLEMVDPFITESGSGIFTPVNHNPFEPALGEKIGEYYLQTLGCPYVQARAGLRVLANLISHPLKGFGDFTVEQLERLTGRSAAYAHQAKAREFSEPFMTPQSVDLAVLAQTAEEMGFKVVLRAAEESRFSELIGAKAGLREAITEVIAAYEKRLKPAEKLQVLGLCDRPEELADFATSMPSTHWTNVTIHTATVDWIAAVEAWLA